jgi:hypothetical protein
VSETKLDELTNGYRETGREERLLNLRCALDLDLFGQGEAVTGARE